ncbi:uncharacterized protein LOC111084037, partial [Limulus polyphemus]|uniref:Uncharacterized protein LOC111084037 n=1 Tax=Limulus polyphemus TaxID=6850 RepID=A0ABM1RYR6_LIMPO
IFSQPLRTDLICNDVCITAAPSGGTNNVPTTYSNPLPSFCGTPSSTTGPMIPVTNFVNPQLIQASTSPNNKGLPFSSTISSTRFYIRKSCNHRCLCNMATIVLILVAIVITTIMAYFAATSTLVVNQETNKPCIVFDDGGMSQNTMNIITSDSKVSNGNYQSSCFAIPSETVHYSQIVLDSSFSKRLGARHSWTVWFNQTKAAWVRFNLTTPRSVRLAILARRNWQPSLTKYDIYEIVSPEQSRTYKRAAV